MSIEKDDQIQQAYSVFNRQHGRLRDELLARLAQENAAAPGNASPPDSRRLRIGRWILGSALGIAAMLLVGVTAWQLLTPSNPAANGNLVSSHVSIVKSLFVRGWYDDSESRRTP
jgi:hypothetical protein